MKGRLLLFLVQAQGDSLTYQWYKNDTLIVGATDSAYTTPATVFTDNLSEYHCIVSDSSASGADTSAKATLYVTAAGSRVTTGMQLLYKFNEGSGLTLNDSSGVGAPHNLGINNKQSITWNTDGLGVNDISYITGSTSPTKLIDACVLTDEVTIELWIEPISVNYDGWAKIITLSSDADSFANFTVYQNPNKGYDFLARTTNTDSDGRPALITPNNTVEKKLTHLVCIRYTNGDRKIYINGIEVASGAKSGRFDNWNPASRIQLANQTGDPRAWLGVYHLAAVYGRALNQSEVTANYNVGVARNDNPKFIVQPQDQGAVVGQTIKFQVRSTNTLTSYQWRKNGVDIGGATNDTYITPPLTLSDNNALYSCIVTNPFGSDTSREAKIRVTALNTRVTANRLAYYNFQEGSGNIVNDVLGYLPVNLRIDGATSNYQWKPYGLIVDSASLIKSPGQTTKWYNDVAVGTGEFTFEAWVKPANRTQSSANILSIGHASDPSRINFAMKQNGGVLQSWLRTNTTPNNGVLMESSANSVGDSLIHITFTHGSNGKSQIFINGVMVKEDYFVGDLDTWRSDYFLRIGEQYLATSPWRGLFNLVSFYTRVLNPTEILQNYTVGPINVNLIAPANLTAQATQPGKVQLAWADNSTNEDGFIIERKQGVQNFAAIDSVGLNVVAFTDSTVADTTNYTYRVKAYTLVRQAISNTASVTTLPSSVAAPTNLTASLSPTLVNRALLSWQDKSNNELGFVVERKTGDSASVDPFTVLATLAANSTSFVDSTLADTTTYTFRVKAFDAFQASNYSNMASVTTVLSTLASPANLAAILSPTIINRAQLSWQDKSSNELGFIIERKMGDAASVNPFVIIDSVAANVTSFEDATLADTTTYTFRVNAFNQYMKSGYSNLASVTTVLSTIAAPSNLLAFSSPADSHDVKLMWNDNSSNEFGFVVERKTGDSLSGASFNVIKLTASDVTIYEDTSALGSTTYTYRVKAFDFLIGSSNYTNLAQITTPVPVDFTSFVGNVISGRIHLDWETATEINNSGFSVQRSNDNTKFIDVAFIKGKGTTTTPSSYSYLDKSILSGKYYYRLKQVDYDGSATFSKPIEVDLGIPKDYSLEQNYPNPFNPSTTIRFALPINAKVSLKIFNTLGEEVASVLNADLEAGIHETVFNASVFSSGVYFYSLNVQGVNGSNFTSTKRMILMSKITSKINTEEIKTKKKKKNKNNETTELFQTKSRED